MNNETKNKLTSGTKQNDLTVGNACWETPPLVFAKISEDFGPFGVDLTADPQRRLCPVWFGPGSVWSEDALAGDWGRVGLWNGYSNPPYGAFIQAMLATAKAEAVRGFTSTLLLPLRITEAFKAHVLDGASDLLFCSKRITFFENGVPRLNEKFLNKRTIKGTPCKPRSDGSVFDSIIVRYVPGVQVPRVGLWEVPKHVTKTDLDRAVERRKALALEVA